MFHIAVNKCPFQAQLNPDKEIEIHCPIIMKSINRINISL